MSINNQSVHSKLKKVFKGWCSSYYKSFIEWSFVYSIDVLVIAEQMLKEEVDWKQISHLIEFEYQENSTWKRSAIQNHIRHIQLQTLM